MKMAYYLYVNKDGELLLLSEKTIQALSSSKLYELDLELIDSWEETVEEDSNIISSIVRGIKTLVTGSLIVALIAGCSTVYRYNKHDIVEYGNCVGIIKQIVNHSNYVISGCGPDHVVNSAKLAPVRVEE